MANKIKKETSTKIELGGYDVFLKDLKTRIRSTQIKAALSVNRELIGLYWEIGKNIVERQENAAWGDEDFPI
jgi:hypothetical protein